MTTPTTAAGRIGCERLELVFSPGALVGGVVQNVQDLATRLPGENLQWLLYGRRIKSPQNLIRRTRDTIGFDLECSYWGLECGYISSAEIEYLFITRFTPSPLDWQQNLTSILSDVGFRFGWVAAAEYAFWQHAKSLQTFEFHGKSVKGLPLVPNGLPYPLSRQVVDTSRNPGRRVFRRGYIEAVGATMWLGAPFWKLTGASESAVRAARWLDVVELPNDVIQVKTWPENFTSAEGEQGKIQRELRRLLFPGSEP